MRFVKIITCLVFTAALLFVGSCTDRRTDDDMKDTLIYGYGENFKTFDPARQIYAQESAIIQLVLQPLVRWNNDIEMEGCMATDWNTPDDCATWVFNLRQGVTFHDGTPFNSAAVKTHFSRMLDPATGSSRRKRIEMIKEIETPDDYTVIFHLDPPNCIFPEIITGTLGHIPSPASIEKWGMDINRHPVGTGPFRFVEWKPDVHIKLERFPDFWNAENIHIEKLELRPIPENTTRLILLEQGVIDMAAVSYEHVNVARETDDISLQSVPQLSIRYVGFNTQKPPFDDVRVRQACNYAINKDDVIKYVFFNVGEPARGPMPSIMPDYNPEIRHYDYDPERAKELLAEAGYPNGLKAVIWTTELGTYRKTAEAILGYLKEIGIEIEMVIYDNASYWDHFDEYLTREGEMFPTKEGCFDIYIGGWVGGESADGFLQPLFTTGSYSNASFYSNPRVDELVKIYRNEPDPLKRRVSYREIQKIVVEEAPWIFAFHGQVNTGIRKRVKNFKVNPSGMYFFEGVTLDDEN